MQDAIWSRTLLPATRSALLASDPLPGKADVVVVGAGLVGLCAALSLRRRGVGNIVVVDRSSVCGESTGASAGGLWPAHECLTLASPDVALKARDLHAALREEFACDYVRSGVLRLMGEGEVSRGLARVERTREAGFAAELLTGDELAPCEPLLRHAGAAIRFPDDGSIHPLKLAAGIAEWLRSNGVKICLDEEVLGISPAPIAITTSAGSTTAGSIVVAAGAWTPLLTKMLGWCPPIRPIRGTLLATEIQPARTLRSIVIGQRYYYWQLASGPLAGGGSEEDVGFREGSDDAVAADIRREWTSLFPPLRSLRFTSRWSGFRPFCEDMQPVVGRVPGCDGVYVSAGHFRKGILLAPLSGELLADQLLGNRQWGPAEAFRPDRFPLAAPLCR